MDSRDKLRGIRGWLILVAIGVIVTPIRLVATYLPVYVPLFTGDTWRALTTVGSEAYHPLWRPLLIGEITFNSALVAASVYLAYLFFSKHHLFPRFYIGIVVVSLVFIPLDAWLLSFVLPNEPVFDSGTAKEFAKTLFVGLIWVPYLLFSKRVKKTFVARMDATPPGD